MNRRSFLQTVLFPIGLALLSGAAVLSGTMLLTAFLAAEWKAAPDSCRKLVYLPIVLSGLAAGWTSGRTSGRTLGRTSGRLSGRMPPADTLPDRLSLPAVAAVMAAAFILMGFSASGRAADAWLRGIAAALSVLIGGCAVKSVGKRRKIKPGKAHVRARPRRRPL